MKHIFILFLSLNAFFGKAQSFKEINDSIYYHYQAFRFEQAIPFAEKALVYVKEKYGTENQIFPRYLYLLAGMYVSSGTFSKAEPLFIEIINIYKKLKTDSTKEYIRSVSMLAVIYNTFGEDDKAIPLLTEAAEYYKKKVGETDPEYVSALNKLAKVYDAKGLYEEAAELFVKSRDIISTTKGINDPAYATVINNLGLVYKSMGKPEKAEPLLLQAMEIRKKANGDTSDDYANSLNNLAALYTSLGQFEKAVAFYTRAIVIYKKTKGTESAEYITTLTNLGSTYERLSDYTNAETVLLTAMKISEENYKEDGPLRVNITQNLGQLYLATEQYDKAGPYIQQVVAIEERKNNNSDAYAHALNDLAFWYNHTNRKKEAEEAYRKSAAITKATLGSQHSDYAATLNNLAMLFLETGRYAEAVPVLSEVTQIELQNLLNLFTILSEEEKSTYIEKNIFLQHNNLSLLYNFPAAPASFYKENYNLQLLTKSLLLADTKNVLEYIRSSDDPAIKKILSNWQMNKAVLSKEYALTDTKRRPDLKLLEAETEKLEKELIKISSRFGNLQKGLVMKTEDIQKNMEQDEAVIEFVTFKLIEKNDNIRTMYAALVLKKNEEAPVFVSLCDEKQLQRLIDSAGKTPTGRVKNFYRGFEIKNKAASSMGTELYKLVWAPLEPCLKIVKKISYSPAGKLYSIAFNALRVDSTTLLLDKYKLFQYTSTREIAQQKEKYKITKPTSIALFGGANFSMDSLALVKTIKNKATTDVSVAAYKPVDKAKRGGIWINLPGTAEEVKKISGLFVQNKIAAKSFINANASENNLKVLNSQAPQVLHIATHGFFLPAPNDRKRSGNSNVYSLADNPLLRSGLVLSGGNYAWSGKTPIKGIEDGIVTAYEISQLNLSNTELVVLSACETALGDVKGSEGVFGLQRAFKMAGVKKMIVSLWQVPDKETAELMISFYTYWMKGEKINEAFAQAQADMRKKYSPFYWAAFVLVE